jgi:hypothetical protein
MARINYSEMANIFMSKRANIILKHFNSQKNNFLPSKRVFSKIIQSQHGFDRSGSNSSGNNKIIVSKYIFLIYRVHRKEELSNKTH